MQTLSPEQMDWLVHVLKFWTAQVPMVKTLVVLIGLDIISGWILAIAKHTLNSTTSFAGMCKKAMILLIVAVGIVLEPYANGLPLSFLIAMGYAAQEGLSIIENAAALGVPLPVKLIEVLIKLQDGKKAKLEQRSAGNAAIDRNTDATDRQTEALMTRIEQEEKVKPVVVVNDPEHAVPITVAPVDPL